MSATGKLSVTELEARYLSGGTKAIKDYYAGYPILVVLPDGHGQNSITWTPHESDSSIVKPETPVSGEYVLDACKVIPTLPPGSVITPVRGHNDSVKVVTVGRSDECDVRFHHNSVSRNHAVFDLSNNTITIEDLDSMNGTSIDGILLDPRRPTLISPPREVQFGEVQALLLDWETLLDVCKP